MKISSQNKILLPLLLLMLSVGGTSLFGQVTGQVCYGEEICISVDGLRGDVQWQSSIDAIAFTDLANETNDTLCLTALETISYRAVIASEEGCAPVFSDTILVSVSTLQAAAGFDTTSCPGDSVILGGSPSAMGVTPPYNVLWSGSGISQPTIENPAAAPASNETYVVNVTDQNGCIVTDTVMLDIIPVTTGSDTFVVNNSFYAWAVPACITSVNIETWGASANNASGAGGSGGTPGKGGFSSGDLDVTNVDTLYIYVGATNGYNGGAANGGGGVSQGGNGGGASDVRVGGQALTNRVIVAGGGGGGGGGSFPATSPVGGDGGDGGGVTGNSGNGDGSITAPSTGGTGGTQIGGGIGGAGSFGCTQAGGTGNVGLLGIGGSGGDATQGNCPAPGANAGGGGGGYYGGGGGGGGSGGNPAAGGGGGSSYIVGVTNGSTTAGMQTGNGQVVITW